MSHQLILPILCFAFIAQSAEAQMPRPQRPPRPGRTNNSSEETKRMRPELRPFEGAKYKNTIRVYPLTNFDHYIGGGISYERLLDQEGRIGFILPISFGVGTSTSPFVAQPYFLNGEPNEASALFINPGLKFYPKGQKRVSYALGVSLFALSGSTYASARTNPPSSFYEKTALLKTGLLVNNYLQFNISNHVNCGMEIGLGPSYLNRITYDNPSLTIDQGIKFFGQAAFHIGYKF